MGRFIPFEKPFSRKWFRSYLLIVLGTFAVAAGYVFFISPHKIVPGGVYGIAIMIHYTLGFPIGVTALFFNIPLTILGIKVLGPRFGVKTVVGFILTSVFVDGLYYLWGNAALVEEDTLLSCIFGGLLIGLGVGLVFKAKASSGGTDLVSMMLGKVTKMPLGQLSMMVDSTIVLASLLVFGDWKIPLYSFIVIFILGKVVDVTLQGISYDKTLFIISDKYEEIRDKIINDLNRGGTFIQGEGMYNGAPKKIIYVVVSRRELAMLEEFISQIDPGAFLSVVDANEILGKGFKSLHEKVTD
ncbi:MAG TPA: YitT family protein [Bacteroidales bacterium]|nr:YitT family protein [Bacteroidales bacterium]HRZ49073.1 YitT family protein [Bacteroidales bacterium]